MAEFIGCILELYLDIKHWFQIKKRRKFEKENNLPKSIVWHPMTKPFVVFSIIFLISAFIFFSFVSKNEFELKTKKKLNEISEILEAEKKEFGKYPVSLNEIIRNNPLRKNITLDYWKNEFIYRISKDSLNYTLISLGKDRQQNTSDDIKITN
ncbi:MAG: type II secretion system protein GspG [Polaribacter sp.]|uniref:type II secretion system protein GspG n=1 Tax=Polaribacter sp. TaxID=1920175 RepID=UPI003BAFA6DC